MSPAADTLASRAAKVGGGLAHRIRTAVDPSSARPAGSARTASGWLAVTVLAEASDVDPEKLPAPLAELEDRIEVRVRPAPGDKGVELAARLRGAGASGSPLRRGTGTDPESELRSALRRAKQLIEVGEVLAVDPAPHGERTATPGGVLLEAWTKVAPGGGVR